MGLELRHSEEGQIRSLHSRSRSHCPQAGSTEEAL